MKMQAVLDITACYRSNPFISAAPDCFLLQDLDLCATLSEADT